MVAIDISCSLENMRRFIILSCCYSFIPEEYLEDENIFPERIEGKGLIYTEAEDKVTLDKIGDIQFVRAEKVVGISYNSKSSLTRLKWEHTSGTKGRLKGEITANSVMKIIEAGIITAESLKPRNSGNP